MMLEGDFSRVWPIHPGFFSGFLRQFDFVLLCHKDGEDERFFSFSMYILEKTFVQGFFFFFFFSVQSPSHSPLHLLVFNAQSTDMVTSSCYV